MELYFCDKCSDTGKVGRFFRKVCPQCGGNPKKYYLGKYPKSPCSAVSSSKKTVQISRRLKDEFMIIELRINVGKDPSITSSEDLAECFERIIGFTSAYMGSDTVIQAFVKACKEWNIKIECPFL